MSFIWPQALVGIALAALVFVGLALGTKVGRLPLIFVTAALMCLSVAIARPSATLDVPRVRAQVMLVFDTSGSMNADDVDPTRLDVAKTVASTFTEERGGGIDVGIVSFGDGGAITLPPTDDTDEILAAIDRLQPSGGTSLVEGVQAALDALTDGPLVIDRGELSEGQVSPLQITENSATIVVFSDGEDTNEADPLPMANLSASSAVQVHTVGVGTAEGATLDLDGFTVATSLNEQALQALAEVGNGSYFQADDSTLLTAIASELNKAFIVEAEETELGALAVIAALILAIIGVLLSQRRSGRLA